MVERKKLPACGKRARRTMRGNTLHKKLLRDMARNAMQFIAIVLLCGLGTWIFSGLDATWRMMDVSIESYFEEMNLADFWVNDAMLTRQDLSRLAHLPGIEQVQARTSLDMDVSGLGDDVSLQVHAFDGDIAINVPLVTEGNMMRSTDLRGCMLDDQFAAAQGLDVGDTVTLTVLGEEHSFVIRALVKSPEHVILARDVVPDPLHYGFAFISSQALPGMPFTEAVIDLAPGADAAAVEHAISELLPSALVLTQKTRSSVERIRNDVVMFRSLGYVFPLLAFAVAAMIVLTTLTRMVENQRMQMGTLKALGYSDRQIRRHYLSYALYPSLVGAVGGLFVGQWTLPYVLWDMEAGHFVFPWQIHAPISLPAWLVTALSVVLSLFICQRTYNKAARETTASLLRPKPPVSGSRILLERITPLWRRFSFNTKMIIRNLLRNKGRTAMMLLGMLCCNMLIICTLGLQDSISYSVRQYYGGTLRYDLRADLDATGGTIESYRARLDAQRVEGVMEKSISLRSATAVRTALLTVLEEDQIQVALGKNQTVLPMPDEGVVISSRLAEMLSLAPGDTAEVWLPGDTIPLHVTVAQLVETNLGQGVYIGRTQWEHFRKGGFQPTALLLSGPSDMCLQRLDAMDEVTKLTSPTDQYDQTMTIMESTTGAFTIMSGAALALAFVICYNMGLMSFTERTRDYATLKVLGYHQREIRRLMLHENDLTAVLGVALGVWPGILLTQVVLKSCETEASAFVACVSVQSIAIASAITFVFTWLIELFLTRKVRSIDMVEALKSVE